MFSKSENIISGRNVKVKNLISKKNDLYLFEGKKLVLDILNNSIVPSLLILNIDGTAMLDYSIPEGVPVWRVSEKVIKKISSLKSPPDAIAVFDELPRKNDFFSGAVIFAVDSIQDPGNLGSLFRCAAAFGIASIALMGECVRLSNTKFLRTAQNSVFHIAIKKFDSLQVFIKEAESRGVNIYLTSSHQQEKQTDVREMRLPAAVVIGNEGQGVDSKFLENFPAISVRQTGLVESLNAGISGCILMNILAEKFDLTRS